VLNFKDTGNLVHRRLCSDLWGRERWDWRG